MKPGTDGESSSVGVGPEKSSPNWVDRQGSWPEWNDAFILGVGFSSCESCERNKIYSDDKKSRKVVNGETTWQGWKI